MFVNKFSNLVIRRVMAGNFFIDALNTGSYSILRHQAEIRVTNYLYRSFYVSTIIPVTC